MTRNQYHRPLLPKSDRPDTSFVPKENASDFHASLSRPATFGEVETGNAVTFSEFPLSKPEDEKPTTQVVSFSLAKTDDDKVRNTKGRMIARREIAIVPPDEDRPNAKIATPEEERRRRRKDASDYAVVTPDEERPRRRKDASDYSVSTPDDERMRPKREFSNEDERPKKKASRSADVFDPLSDFSFTKPEDEKPRKKASRSADVFDPVSDFSFTRPEDEKPKKKKDGPVAFSGRDSPKPADEKPKANPARPRVITFDDVLPNDPPPKPKPSLNPSAREDLEIPGDQPIRASGVYNLGDDIDFDDIPTIPTKKRPPVKRAAPKPQPAATVQPRPKAKSALVSLPPPAKSPLPQIMDKLKSSDWTDQNQAISELSAGFEQLQVQTELRGLMTSLLDCAASPRSALAKNALGCIQKLVNSGASFDPIADMCASSLLGLIVSHKEKHFLSDLASQSFSQMLDTVSPNTAADVLISEYRRKHDDARVHVASAMAKLAARTTDFSRLLKPLVTLVRDKNPSVRNAARIAVSMIRSRASNFSQMVESFENEEDRSALLHAF
jgi:hypothetical protein